MQSKSPVRAVLTMKRQTGAERRLHPRYPLNPGLPNVALALQGLHNEGHELLRAQIQNLSTSGVCLLGDRPLELSQVFRCEIQLPGLPVGIPTLLQVRWIDRPLDAHAYRVGLQFVF